MKVVKRLQAEGFCALFAGGCVRDMLLGKIAHDYDIATNATPKTITKLFRRTLTVGARFGVVVVLVQDRQIEVATFRSDASYANGRRPDRVVFTDARHDALRRDFTINGMFLDPVTDEVIDYVGGRADLNERIVRAIGDPNERFAEDHLRMLRAIRFACRLDFRIADKTARAIRRQADKITRISPERIASELEQIITDPNRLNGVKLARALHLLDRTLPQLDDRLLDFGIDVLGQLPGRCSFASALAALLAQVTAGQLRQVCTHLRMSNELRKQVTWLVVNREPLLDSIPLSRGRLKKWLAEPLFELLVQHARCCLKAGRQSTSPLRRLQNQITQLGDEPISPTRLLDGHELIGLGATPGPTVGRLAEELYLAQLENEVKSKRQAINWARKWLATHRQDGGGGERYP